MAASGRDYMTIGEVVENARRSAPGPHDLQGPLPRGRGARLARAHGRRLPQVPPGRRRAHRAGPAAAEGALPAARGHPREARRTSTRARCRRSSGPLRHAGRGGRAAVRGGRDGAARQGARRLGLPAVVHPRARRVRAGRARARASTARSSPGPDVAIAHACWDLRRFGIEPRHLRMYETFAEREAALFSQILMPALRHRTPEARQKLDETLAELTGHHERAKRHLLERALGRTLRRRSVGRR